MSQKDINEFMVDWALNYFKSRDAFKKNIVSTKKEHNKLVITYKDKTEEVLSAPELNGIELKNLTENTIIFTLNNRKNIDFVHDNWLLLKDKSTLKIYFINPFSTTDTKWIINPSVHDRICDEKSLKLGLLSMFENVQPLTVEILKNKLAV